MANAAAEAPEHCPGTESEQAGKAAACAGCPNQDICAASKPAGPDPDLGLVLQRMEAVRHKVLVLSGKGGVGKSTFTAQLAFGLAANEDCEVAVMEWHICGPFIPKVMGLEGEQVHQSGSGWSPVYVQDNLAVMSVGFLLASPEDAVIWRGPKKNGMIKQFLKDVDWGTLDYLVIDTPPGTSDEHLSLAQYLKDANPSGALIVTTPQEVALIDVRKEIGFCRKVGLDIIGVVENMSGFVCPNCQTEAQIFAPTTGGAEAMCKELGCAFLGRVPLDPRIARCCDEGKSFVETHRDSPAATALVSVVEGVVKFCEAKHSEQ